MSAFRYITYQDILDRDPVANFARRKGFTKRETEAMMRLCEYLGISGASEHLKVIQAGKTATYHQLRHLYNEIKLRKLLLDILRGGVTMTDEGLLDRAERFQGLVKMVDGERVIVGTYRDLVQRQSYYKVKRRKISGFRHIDVQ